MKSIFSTVITCMFAQFSFGQGVGIGLSNPENKVDINGFAYREGFHAVDRPLYVTGNIGAGSGGIEFRHYNGTQGIGFGFNTIYAAGSWADQGLGLSTYGLGQILFQTNGLDRMRISGGGDVGIGVSSPVGLLDVGRSLNYGTSMIIRGSTHWSYFNFSGDEHTYIRGGKDGSHVILNDGPGFGNVGIGTGNPLQKLHVEGNAYVTQSLGIGVASPQTSLDVARGTGFDGSMIVQGTTHWSHFNYGDAEHIFIRGGKAGSHVILNDLDNLGNIGIGTNSPQQKLHVAGNAYISQGLGIGTNPVNALIQTDNSIVNRKLVLFDNQNNDHQFYGLGINGGMLRYQVDGIASNHVFYAATSTTTSRELMRIRGNGNVRVDGSAELGHVIVAQSVDIAGFSYGSVTCDCPAGTKVIGGGASCNYSTYFELTSSYPSSSTSWTANGNNPGGATKTLTAHAICARITN